MTVSVRIFLLVPFFWILIPPAGMSQLTEADIMLSGNYHWGEGYAETRDEAVSFARVDLIEKLVVVIDSEIRSEVQETEDQFRSEYASRTRSLSRMQLRGLNYKNTQRRDGTWRSIAYISKNDYQNTLDIEREKLSGMLNQAFQSERRAGLHQAAPFYAELLVERQFYPIPFFTQAESHGEETELAGFIQNRLRSWMDHIRISVRDVEVYGDANLHETNIRLELTYMGQPVNHLLVGFDRSGYGMMEVMDGLVTVFVDLLPDAPEMTYRLVFQPQYRGSDPDLRSIAELTLPQVRRRVTADVLSHIGINFSVTRIGTGGYQFNPQIENLAVSDLRWDFGDGTTSSQSAPRHAFAERDKAHVVTLRVNRNDQLTVQKELLPDGTLRAAEDRRAPVRDVVVREETVVREEQFTDQEKTGPVAGHIRPETDDPVRPEPFVVPPRHRDIVEELKRSRGYDEALARLSHYQRQNRLRFGDRRTVGETRDCYVFVINTDLREIEAFLSPEVENTRLNLHNNEQITELSERFRGRAPLWIQIY